MLCEKGFYEPTDELITATSASVSLLQKCIAKHDVEGIMAVFLECLIKQELWALILSDGF